MSFWNQVEAKEEFVLDFDDPKIKKIVELMKTDLLSNFNINWTQIIFEKIDLNSLNNKWFTKINLINLYRLLNNLFLNIKWIDEDLKRIFANEIWINLWNYFEVLINSNPIAIKEFWENDMIELIVSNFILIKNKYWIEDWDTQVLDKENNLDWQEESEASQSLLDWENSESKKKLFLIIKFLLKLETITQKLYFIWHILLGLSKTQLIKFFESNWEVFPKKEKIENIFWDIFDKNPEFDNFNQNNLFYWLSYQYKEFFILILNQNWINCDFEKLKFSQIRKILYKNIDFESLWLEYKDFISYICSIFIQIHWNKSNEVEDNNFSNQILYFIWSLFFWFDESNIKLFFKQNWKEWIHREYYKVIKSDIIKKIINYFSLNGDIIKILTNSTNVKLIFGQYLFEIWIEKDLSQLTINEIIEILIQYADIKQPKINDRQITQRTIKLDKDNRKNWFSKPNMVLTSDSLALQEKRTIFPKTLIVPRIWDFIFSSWKNNTKLWDKVQVWRLKWAKFFQLVLSERAHCPQSCVMLRSCYWNNMHRTKRYTPSLNQIPTQEEIITFFEIIESNVELLNKKFPEWVLIRLHTLWDFNILWDENNIEYVLFWEKLLEKYHSIYVFWFTQFSIWTPIWDEISRIRKKMRSRFSFRTSNKPEMNWMAANVINREPTHNKIITLDSDWNPVTNIICPNNIDPLKFQCSTCWLCWQRPDVNILFLQH